MDVVSTSIGNEAGNKNGLVCNVMNPILDRNYPSNPWKPKNTVIKYTKIPNFDFKYDTAVMWPNQNSYILPPHLRRIVTMDETAPLSTRSLKPLSVKHKPNTSTVVSDIKRKVVSMIETEEGMTGKSAKTNYSKKYSMSTASQKSNRQKISEQTTLSKHTAGFNNVNIKKNIPNNIKNTVSKTQKGHINDITKFKEMLHENESFSRNRNKVVPIVALETDVLSNNYSLKKTRPLKMTETQRHESIMKNINGIQDKAKKPQRIKRNTTHKDSLKTEDPDTANSSSPAKCCSRAQSTEDKVPPDGNHTSPLFAKNNKNHVLDNIKMISKLKSPRLIESKVNTSLVQRDRYKKKQENKTNLIQNATNKKEINPKARNKIANGDGNAPKVQENRTLYLIECGTSYETSLMYKEENTNTEIVMKSDVISDTADLEKSKSAATTVVIEELNIPDVYLVKDKHRTNDTLACSRSWPDLNIPPLKVSQARHTKPQDTESGKRSTSQIIGRATVTYTTKHQIDFQVHSEDGSASSVDSSRFTYPCSVVSLFKKDLCISDHDESLCASVPSINKKAQKNAINKLKWKTNSCVFNEEKLVKPSHIVSSIRLVSVLLEDDYISEQFQRELNFIDSFFESLQYLENCSYSYKSVLSTDNRRTSEASYLEYKNSSYCSDITKPERDTNVCDSNTTTSKSLCLLNNLIQDEQKRAKNLLFVLKMRENALKDFTKSQILWLENKKKIENIDVSTLKKKQRGALLKLQYECGEMNRMRKALLKLSEKRKEELIKTKKNIESKLSNNVDYNSLLSDKKRLRKSSSMDRQIAPLKCFELSNSWDECYTNSKLKLEGGSYTITKCKDVVCEEKSIQTSFSNNEPNMDKSRDSIPENSVVVDGKYLNILFQSLSIPEIFSCGKNYEVNEKALNNIVASGKHINNENVCSFLNQMKNLDEKSRSPSTARSLVDELEQCYKNMFEEGSSESNSEKQSLISETVVEDSVLSTCSQVNEDVPNVETDCDKSLPEEIQCEEHVYDEVNEDHSPPGPLPVPAGQPADTPSEDYTCTQHTLEAIVEEESVSPPPKVDTEAEILLKQQIAIEREIKALEQQQNQLLIVREIPDKPPPPYMPPNDVKMSPVQPCKFTISYVNDDVIRDAINSDVKIENNDPFNMFLRDFCTETMDRHKNEKIVKPWDVCYMPPKSQEDEHEKLIKNTAAELKDVLLGAPKAVLVSGVRSGRSDHIEDILFSKWHQCESEWTSLHIDENSVKKQVSDGILVKLLCETIEEYRAIAQN